MRPLVLLLVAALAVGCADRPSGGFVASGGVPEGWAVIDRGGLFSYAHPPTWERDPFLADALAAGMPATYSANVLPDTANVAVSPDGACAAGATTFTSSPPTAPPGVDGEDAQLAEAWGGTFGDAVLVTDEERAVAWRVPLLRDAMPDLEVLAAYGGGRGDGAFGTRLWLLVVCDDPTVTDRVFGSATAGR